MTVDRSLDKVTNNNKNGMTKTLTKIIEVLNKFSDNYEKRLNFEKLTQHLKLDSSEADEILSLLLGFQDLFTQTLKGYRLQKKIVNNQLYLILEKKSSLSTIPKKITLTKTESNVLNDIIYLFKFVKKGKGFDVVANGTELLSNIKDLCDFYPFLFQSQNGLLYPSEFGQKVGELILSYKKSNKQLDVLQLDDCEVRIV